jgi:hypothetical protein
MDISHVTVEYRPGELCAVWHAEGHDIPPTLVTIKDLRSVQKYGRWWEPRSFTLLLSRLTVARCREVLAFLAAMLHRAVAALHLAGLFRPGRALDQARPAASLLVLCPQARAPNGSPRGVSGNRGVSPP